MVHTCCVYGCVTQQCKDRISFFRIPMVIQRSSAKDQMLMRKRRRMWAVALQRELLNDDKLSKVRVCELHFISGKPAHYKDTTNVDWVPNQQLQLIPGERGRHALSPKRWCPAKEKLLFQAHNEEQDDDVQRDRDIHDSGSHIVRDSHIEPELQSVTGERIRHAISPKRSSCTKGRQQLQTRTDEDENVQTNCDIADSGSHIKPESTRSEIEALKLDLRLKNEEINRLREELAVLKRD